MIRIHRPAKVPSTLKKRGKQQTALLCGQYDANHADYDSGSVRFLSADNKIYGSADVKNALKTCQHNKCCYSEAKFVRDYVPVEHFRPKSAIGQQGSNKKQYPGYYWLAYEWSNLLLCKPGINSNKKDYFPLLDDHARAKNHRSDLSLECPVLIDPASEDPREHIRFHNEEPYAYRSSKRGEITIKLLLRHPDIDEQRRTHFQHLSALKDALKALGDNGNEEKRSVAAGIQALLHAATQPDAEYSSMAIDLLSR